ncbi:MAG: hypothetical protein ACRELT_00235 [Longimicrobiales bacterium]
MRNAPDTTPHTAPDDEQAQKAIERERLGGPADYAESGGTGLEAQQGTAGDESEAEQRGRDGDGAAGEVAGTPRRVDADDGSGRADPPAREA